MKDNPGTGSFQRRAGLLRDQVQLVKRKDSDRYEIVPIAEQLSLEKGFFVVIRACQLLAQKNKGIILIGIAGPSGAGKSVFTEKILNFMPSMSVISMDNYNDASRIIDGNFDDPRLTDYDTLLDNIRGLKEGKSVQVPIYDYKKSCRTGYRTVEVPASRIVIIEGIYALSQTLRPFLDLRVSITGGVHFDLVKRVLRDIQRAGQEPEEIIHQISETVYPMYKAFIEPDLQAADVRIVNKFNPFTGFQNPTYILKSLKSLTPEQVKDIMPRQHKETMEETYDIYLLPPGEDPETCHSYLRMRNRDGKYSLMFEEWVTDSPFIISPRITFEGSVRLLGGLMALGYTIAAILKRNSHSFSDDRVSVKIDWLAQLNRHYVQVQGRDRLIVRDVAKQLELEGSYVPRTYIEQIQLEKLVDEVMALPDDLKTKLSIDDDMVLGPREALSKASADQAIRKKNTERDQTVAKLMKLKVGTKQLNWRVLDSNAPVLPNQGAITQLSEQISSLNEKMDEFTSRIEELNAKLNGNRTSSIKQNLGLQAEACNGFYGAPYSSQLVKGGSVMKEISVIGQSQNQIIHQLDKLSDFLHRNIGLATSQRHGADSNKGRNGSLIGSPLIILFAAGGISALFLRIYSRD